MSKITELYKGKVDLHKSFYKCQYILNFNETCNMISNDSKSIA